MSGPKGPRILYGRVLDPTPKKGDGTSTWAILRGNMHRVGPVYRWSCEDLELEYRLLRQP